MTNPTLGEFLKELLSEVRTLIKHRKAYSLTRESDGDWTFLWSRDGSRAAEVLVEGQDRHEVLTVGLHLIQELEAHDGR